MAELGARSREIAEELANGERHLISIIIGPCDRDVAFHVMMTAQESIDSIYPEVGAACSVEFGWKEKHCYGGIEA